MKRKELLEQMKHNMVTHLEDLRADEEQDGEFGDVKALDRDIKKVKKATDLGVIFDAMNDHAWDVPGAIMFVVRCAIEDPDKLRVGDAYIPTHWST